MKKIVCILMVLLLVSMPAFAAAKLGFSASNDIAQLQELNGKQVTIVGYMATLSPISGKYMYLMDMPYQSCPFCVPNTQQLANTMAVYAKQGKTFDFTDRAIEVTGTLKVEDYEDEFGYNYNYRVVDAEYRVVDMSELPEKYVLWQVIAEDGIVGEVYTMFDFLHFCCQWQDYMFNYYDEDGNYQQVNIYAGDVMNILEDDGDYGYAAETALDYYPSLISRARSISLTDLEELVQILERCEALRDEALDLLYGGAFEYHEDGDYFTQNDYDYLQECWYEVWYEFSDWLSYWEM